MNYLLNIDPRLNTTSEQMQKLHWKLPTIIQFQGDFTEESTKNFRQEIEMAENMAIESKQEFIPITIDSNGGDVYGLLSMIDAIKSCSVPVATIVEAKAFSAGAILMSFGAEGHRYIAPNATTMIHSAGAGFAGRNEQMQKNAGELDRLSKKLFEMISKNCGKHKDYFYDLYKENHCSDLYMDADMTLRHNLANHIGVPKFKINIGLDFSFSL